jgi:hypothetical protein
MLADSECRHLVPEFLCRVCSAPFPRFTVTRRISRPPERQRLHEATSYLVQSINAELVMADFAEIERRVVARYRPKTILDE